MNMSTVGQEIRTGTRLALFLKAIGYPEEPGTGVAAFTLQVDGGELVAAEAGDAVRLVCRLTDDAAELPRLAGYAAGRMLREAATLACDRDGAFLWQEAAVHADPEAARRLFETFCDACDWWRARLEPRGGEPAAEPETMVIRP